MYAFIHTYMHTYIHTYINTIDSYATRIMANYVANYLLFNFYSDKPDAPMNVKIPTEHIKTDSFIIQWNRVIDLFPFNYTVRWYGGDTDNTATTNKLRYTVTGLTSNTSYSVSVVAINTCCGTGQISGVVMVTTISNDVVITTTVSDDLVMVTASTSLPNNIAGTYICKCILVFGLHN